MKPAPARLASLTDCHLVPSWHQEGGPVPSSPPRWGSAPCPVSGGDCGDLGVRGEPCQRAGSAQARGGRGAGAEKPRNVPLWGEVSCRLQGSVSPCCAPVLPHAARHPQALGQGRGKSPLGCHQGLGAEPVVLGGFCHCHRAGVRLCPGATSGCQLCRALGLLALCRCHRLSVPIPVPVPPSHTWLRHAAVAACPVPRGGGRDVQVAESPPWVIFRKAEAALGGVGLVPIAGLCPPGGAQGCVLEPGPLKRAPLLLQGRTGRVGMGSWC